MQKLDALDVWLLIAIGLVILEIYKAWLDVNCGSISIGCSYSSLLPGWFYALYTLLGFGLLVVTLKNQKLEHEQNV